MSEIYPLREETVRLRNPKLNGAANEIFNCVGDLLLHRAETSHDMRIEDDHGSSRLSSIVTASLRLARTLQSLGVNTGDRVIVSLPNGRNFLIAWFAVTFLGAIQVPINPDSKGSLLRHFIRIAEPSAAILESRLLEEFREAGLSRSMGVIVTSADPNSDDPDTTILFADACAGDELVNRPSLDRHAPLSILFTSGTTGPSKGVVVSHSMAMWTGSQAIEATGLTEQSKWYCCLPFFHVDAQNLVTMSSVISGADIRITERFSASKFWNDIYNSRASHFTFIGALLEILFKRFDAELPRRQQKIVGIGSPVRRELYREFEQRFDCFLIDTFGMTEITNPIWNPLPLRKPGAAGLVSLDYDVDVFDEAGRSVDPGDIGELVIRPKHSGTFFSGYYGMPTETLSSWRDLWFHTGDRVRIEPDGFVYYVDRLKDVIRRRGENVSAKELEDIVSTLDGVELAAAVGVPSELSGEEIRIFIVKRHGIELDGYSILQSLKPLIPEFMTPRYIDFVKSIPLTPTSKIDKAALRNIKILPDTFDSGFGVRK